MLPAIIFSLFALQWQIAVSLPLEWEDPAAVTATTTTTTTTTTTPTQDQEPWSFLLPCFGSRKSQPASERKSQTYDNDDQASNYIALTPSRSKDHKSNPKTTTEQFKNLRRQLLRRAHVVLNKKTLTAVFVAVIVVSVLLGVGVASIAVCGFDWRRHLARSRIPNDDEVPVVEKPSEVVEELPPKTGWIAWGVKGWI
jgi:hypothetical protein